jgi:prepilin-type processing-associated H-X9-DG protein
VRRRADLLVGLLILVVLAGMLIPAVMRVRDAAARSQCRNNLKQIGLALQNYHNVFNSFPAATMPTEGLPPEKRLSWLYELDPFIHARMDPTWGMNRNKPWDIEENFRITRGPMPIYLCPWNPNREDAAGFGLTHYVGVSGVGTDAARLPKDNPAAGLFGYDRTTKRSEIKDGDSSTLAAIETARDNGPWAAGGPATVRGLDPNRRPYLGTEAQFGGLHGGTTAALFADGSVRFLQNSIDPRIFEALATIAGGEEVGAIDAD